jgi:hypothetical protein
VLYEFGCEFGASRGLHFTNRGRFRGIVLMDVRKNRNKDKEPLQDLLSVIGEQAKTLEEDIEALYENWFIEGCDPWTVPYIGELPIEKILETLERNLRDFDERSSLI